MIQRTWAHIAEELRFLIVQITSIIPGAALGALLGERAVLAKMNKGQFPLSN